MVVTALFLIEPKRVWVDLLVGVCSGLAVHSNAFVAAPLALYFAAYAIVWLASGGRLGTLASRFGAVCAGLLGVTGAGVAYYGWTVGQWDIFSVTLNITTFLVRGGTRNWRTPGIAWMADLWSVLTPVVLIGIALIVHRWRKASIHESVVLLGGIFTTGLFYGHQYLLDGNSLQLHYYFSYALPTVFLLLALIVGRLWQHQRAGVRTVAAIALVLSAVGPWVVYAFGVSLIPTTFVQHLVVIAAAVVCVTIASVLSHWRRESMLVATVAIGVMCVSAFARPVYTSMINPRTQPSQTEMEVYRIALQLIQAVPRWSDHPGGIRFWYSNLPPSNKMQSIQSTYLWGYSKVQGNDAGLPQLGPDELKLIRAADVSGLILLAEDPNDLPRGRDALRHNGISFTVVDDRILTAGASRLYFQRLSLRN
jgi:hypothetical protein